MSLFLGDILKHLRMKCHDVFNLISSDSAKYSCSVAIDIYMYTHMQSERGEGKTCGKMLKTEDPR